MNSSSSTSAISAEHNFERIAIHELWYTRCPVPTVSSLVLDLGRLEQTFASDKIQFRSLRSAGDLAVRHHYSHTFPGLFREGGNVPAIWARANGQNTRVIALTWVDEYQAILTLALQKR
jgi:ABC-type nitrate/sulfonate/bicarbonate transport system substrate-binding protein